MVFDLNKRIGGADVASSPILLSEMAKGAYTALHFGMASFGALA